MSELSLEGLKRDLEGLRDQLVKLEQLCNGEDLTDERPNLRPACKGDCMVLAVAYQTEEPPSPDEWFWNVSAEDLKARQQQWHEAFERSQVEALDTLSDLINAGWAILDSFDAKGGSMRVWIVAGPKSGVLPDVDVIEIDKVQVQPPEIIDATARLQEEDDPFAWALEPGAVEAAMDDAVAKGWARVVWVEGEPKYSLTEEGRKHVEGLVGTPPVAAEGAS